MPPLRKDLLISQQRFEGRTYYVIKDPISMQYFRMTHEDYYLATLFDGARTFGKIREAYVQRFPHVRLDYTTEELQERVLRFANDLALLQFLSVQGTRLKARIEAQRQHKAKKPWLYNLANQVFFFRFSLFDPDKLFGRMARPIAWIWSRPAMWASVAMCLVAAAVFWLNAERIQPTMQNFFAWKNIALIWVTTILIKSIHELGHGLTCKHFGGEVHEVGFMSLVFTPMFFVNVTDAWTMPNRMHRMLISFAGIYVELVIAALATFLWAVVQPGAFQDFLFNVMVVASVSTLVFNANPLMRFDGYYIMTDAIEVPNLQAKSRALVQHQLNHLLFGASNKDQVLSRMPLPKKRFWLFYTYAILSWVYGYYVIYKLAVFMAPHLEPLGLEGLSNWFTALALISWVAVPLIGFFKQMKLTLEDWKPHGRLRRLSLIGSVALGIFGVACFVPVELKITRVGAVELAEPEEVRPEVPGFIAEVLVKEGDRVTASQPVVRLANRELEQAHSANESRLRAAEAQLQRAIGLEHPAEQKQLENLVAQYRAKFAESQRDVAALTIRAKGDGVVLVRDGTLLTHNPTPLLGRLLRNELFCDIVRMDPMRIKIALSEKQVRYVEQGHRVALKADAYPGRTFEGTVASKPLMFIGKEMPAAFSARRSGDVPTGLDRQGHEVPIERVFTADVEVKNPDGILRQGMTGRARIFTGPRPWGKLVLQSLLDLVSLDYRF